MKRVPYALASAISATQVVKRMSGEGETVVMVEGKTDQVLWEEYRSQQDCTLYPTRGKDILIEALKICGKRGYRGIAGIVDADYWLVTEAIELGTENLIYDDLCPDMESILLDSPALRKVLRHSISAEEIEPIHAFADKLKQEAQRLATEFGYFRLLNHLNDYGLRCNSIRFHEIIDIDTLELDGNLVASRLAADQPGLTSEDLLRQVDELRKEYPPCNLQLCRGKDVLEIMATIMPTLYRSQFGEDLSLVSIAAFRPQGLPNDLRLAYEYGYFRGTSLYNCIRKWESDNGPFRIIKQYDFERTAP